MNQSKIKDILIDCGYTLEVIRGDMPPELDIKHHNHFQHIQNQLWKILTTYSFPEEAQKGAGEKEKK